MTISVDNEMAAFRQLPGVVQLRLAEALMPAERYMNEALSHNYAWLTEQHTRILQDIFAFTNRPPAEEVAIYVGNRIEPHRNESDTVLGEFLKLPKEAREYLAKSLRPAEQYFLGWMRTLGEPIPKEYLVAAPDSVERARELTGHLKRMWDLCPDNALFEPAKLYANIRLMLGDPQG